MLSEKLLANANNDRLSNEERKKQLRELQEFIKSQHHLHDDHGSCIIGSRSQAPQFED